MKRRSSNFGGRRSTFIAGDYNVIDDVMGFPMKASEAEHRWDKIVLRQDMQEERHPQDFVRATPDSQRIPWGRTDLKEAVTPSIANNIPAWESTLNGWHLEPNGGGGTFTAVADVLTITEGGSSVYMWMWRPIVFPTGYTFTITGSRASVSGGGGSYIGIATIIGLGGTSSGPDIAKLLWQTTATGSKSTTFTVSLNDTAAGVFYLIVGDGGGAGHVSTFGNITITGAAT